MINKDNNYNKGENLSCCPICKKVFEEGEPVSVIDLPNGPFVIVHKECGNHCDMARKVKKDISSKMISLQDKDKLWRYMDLAKFISIMKDSALYFSNPDSFSDLYEGAHGELKNKQAWDDFYLSFARAAIITAPDNCWHKQDLKSLEENSKRLVEQLSSRQEYGIYISCWHQNEVESEAMWKMYSVHVKNAIAIQTTYGKLKKELGEKASIRPVNYIDYSKQFVGPNDEFWCKRKSFEYEKEVRAIVHNFESKDNSGIEIKVDLKNLIENIYISPYAPNWFQEIVVDLVVRYGYSFNVLSSTMSEMPF